MVEIKAGGVVWWIEYEPTTNRDLPIIVRVTDHKVIGADGRFKTLAEAFDYVRSEIIRLSLGR
jgi:hypothetical protein